MRLLVKIFLTLLLAQSCFASFYEEGAQQVALNIGAGIPLTKIDLSVAGGGSDKVGSIGESLGGQYLFFLNRHIGLGLDGNYTSSGDNNSSKFSHLLDSTINSRATVLLAMVKYSPLTNNDILPYVSCGFGVHNSSLKFTASPANGLFWPDTHSVEPRVLGDDHGSNYALAIGLGVDIPTNEDVFFGAEVRYVYLGSVTYTANAQANALGISQVSGSGSLINLLVRAGYKF